MVIDINIKMCYKIISEDIGIAPAHMKELKLEPHRYVTEASQILKEKV